MFVDVAYLLAETIERRIIIEKTKDKNVLEIKDYGKGKDKH